MEPLCYRIFGIRQTAVQPCRQTPSSNQYSIQKCEYIYILNARRHRCRDWKHSHEHRNRIKNQLKNKKKKQNIMRLRIKPWFTLCRVFESLSLLLCTLLVHLYVFRSECVKLYVQNQNHMLNIVAKFSVFWIEYCM